MTEKDQKFIESLKMLNVAAVLMIISGVFGIGLGLWIQFFRESSPGELMLNKTLILFSLVIGVSAFLNLQSFGVIKRLLKKSTDAS